MARLQSEMCSFLSDTVVNKLHRNRIFTLTAFIQEDPEKLVSTTKLSYKDVIQIREAIIANYSVVPITGFDVYNNLLSNSAFVTTGIESLDRILDGGLQTENIYEICGLSGHGKTQLCLTIGINVVLKLNQKVYYIDTKRDFSAERILKILENRSQSDEKSELIMKNIKAIKITTIYQLRTFLHQLELILKADQDANSSVRLLILDSITSLMFSFVGENYNDGLALLSDVANAIKYLAIKYHVVFVVVNLAVYHVDEASDCTESGDEDNPCLGESSSVQAVLRSALGKYWLHVPNTRLLIKKDSALLRKIIVLKSLHIPLKKTCYVHVLEDGVS